MAISDTDISLAYSLILNRIPSEAEVEHTAQRCETIAALRQALLMSDEFVSRYDVMRREKDAQLRPTLIHVHIPKTAGTTLALALAEEPTLQPRALIHDHMLPELAAMPFGQKRNLRYIHGHLDMNVGAVFGAPHRYLCVIRRPGPRIYSFYRFIKRNTAHPSHREIVDLNLSFGEYLEYSKEKTDHRVEIDNGQLRRLAGRLHDGRFGLSNEYLRPALHAVSSPSMIFGYAEHLGSLLKRLNEEGYLTSVDIQSHNIATEGDTYNAALESFTDVQRAVFEEYTVWDDYFYNLCLSIIQVEN